MYVESMKCKLANTLLVVIVIPRNAVVIYTLLCHGISLDVDALLQFWYVDTTDTYP